MGKLWYGEIRLPIAFWLYAFLGNILVKLPPALFGASLGQRGFELVDLVLYFALILIAVLYFVVSLVGTWRSARSYRQSHADSPRAIWAALAQIWLLFMGASLMGWLLLFATVVRN